VWKDYHRSEGDFQLERSVTFLAELVAVLVVGPEVYLEACSAAYLAVYLEPLHEAYPEEDLVAYPDASLGDEPCEEMHDMMAQSY